MYPIVHNHEVQWETFWDNRGQQTYRVNPLFSELCACSELRKQWKFTRYVCCHLALESLLLTELFVLNSACCMSTKPRNNYLVFCID